MADQDLRIFERRFRETGATHDETAWLKARARAGDFPEGRLRFAAQLGHPAAQQLVDDLVIGELIGRDSLSAHTASSWGWRIRPEDRDALKVVADTVMRFPLVELRGRPGAKPGTKTYVRFLLRHLGPGVDRDEVTEAIRSDLLKWALG